MKSNSVCILGLFIPSQTSQYELTGHFVYSLPNIKTTGHIRKMYVDYNAQEKTRYVFVIDKIEKTDQFLYPDFLGIIF
jgi:hypothetical protein